MTRTIDDLDNARKPLQDDREIEESSRDDLYNSNESSVTFTRDYMLRLPSYEEKD